jgi:hypothetical protein
LALQTAQNIERVSAQAYVSQLIGLYYCGVCRWAEAERLFEQAATWFGQIELQHSWAECTSLQGKICFYQGKFSQGQYYFAQLLSAAQYYGNLAAQHYALVGQAECSLRLGRPALEQVCAWLEQANGLQARYPGYTQQVRLYGLLALVQLYQGNGALAYQTAQTGAQFIKRGGFIAFWAVEGYAGVAETFLSLWETALTGGQAVAAPELLAKSARQACQALRHFAQTYPLGQPRAWLYQGWYEWLVGQRERAYKAWSQSLAAAERLGMPYEAGRAHYELGRHASPPKAGPNLAGPEHLRQAGDIFASLDAAYDLDRVNAEVRMRNDES